jgi:urease subunit beta
MVENKEPIPGEVLCKSEPISLNAGRVAKTITVTNVGDRPIQVGSHYHFFEVNRALKFDRAEAFGFRLNIPAGTAVRFEPGDSKPVTLVAIGGNRLVRGLNNLVNSALDAAETRTMVLERLSTMGFGDKE